MNILLSLSTAWQGDPPTNRKMLSNCGRRCFLFLFLGKGKQTLGQPLPLPRIMFLVAANWHLYIQRLHQSSWAFLLQLQTHPILQFFYQGLQDKEKISGNCQPCLVTHLLKGISCPLGSSSPPNLNRVIGVLTWIDLCQMKCPGKSLRAVGILSI